MHLTASEASPPVVSPPADPTDGSDVRFTAPRGTLILPALALLALLARLLLPLAGLDDAGTWIGRAGLVLTGAPLLVRAARDVLRGRFGGDLVAALAIAGAILLDQPIAGLVIVLMQSGGETLERFAEGRASRALRELIERAPRTAHLLDDAEPGQDARIREVPVEEIAVGHHVLVRPGEMLPVDGVVVDGRSDVDASAVTGEPVPIAASAGTKLVSGCVNGGGALTLRATALARDSQYARIVELVRTAQGSKARIQRLADRYAVWFTPFTLLVCGAVYALTGDPLRLLAVLVVATPCPLILATPVAIIGGVNRTAKLGMIIRRGDAIEALASIDTAVFDKTGTLTVGAPTLVEVRSLDGSTEEDTLARAGAIEQASTHVLARAVVRAAHARGLALAAPGDVVEVPGSGVSGVVHGRRVAVGSIAYMRSVAPGAVAALGNARTGEPGMRAWMTVDGVAAGMLRFDDALRPGLSEFFASLDELGVRRRLLLSGDDDPATQLVARRLGIAEASGDLAPEDKVARVRALEAAGARVVMFGDGINDAPALSTATVGVALAGSGHGGGVADRSRGHRRARRRSDGARPGHPHRAPHAAHREAEHRRGTGTERCRDAVRGVRLHHADRRRRGSGGDRRGGDSERAADESLSEAAKSSSSARMRSPATSHRSLCPAPSTHTLRFGSAAPANSRFPCTNGTTRSLVPCRISTGMLEPRISFRFGSRSKGRIVRRVTTWNALVNVASSTSPATACEDARCTAGPPPTERPHRISRSEGTPSSPVTCAYAASASRRMPSTLGLPSLAP